MFDRCGSGHAGVRAAPALAAAAREVRIGTAPQLPSGTTLVAGSASVQTMQITVALAPRDPAALRNYADGVGEASSRDYRHYLTPSQFRARFAPRRKTLIKVEEELRQHGLKPGSVTSNGLAIHVRASSAAIEHAFDMSSCGCGSPAVAMRSTTTRRRRSTPMSRRWCRRWSA